SARHAFNIKVLRRHDASISSILYSASFVVLYQYSTSSSSWTKTGIEGPMFLFKRSESPFYGAFVLNRNGVENWASSIRGEDDLEVSEDFVIFRSTSDGDGDRVVGIWVFEKEQR
ncbi:PH domain-like protein, partial [Jaminaea rosea]